MGEGPDLWTRISAAWRTGYENSPSLSLDLLVSSSGDASSFNASLLYWTVSFNTTGAQMS
jgi:hypothetical protein